MNSTVDFIHAVFPPKIAH